MKRVSHESVISMSVGSMLKILAVAVLSTIGIGMSPSFAAYPEKPIEIGPRQMLIRCQ